MKIFRNPLAAIKEILDEDLETEEPAPRCSFPIECHGTPDGCGLCIPHCQYMKKIEKDQAFADAAAQEEEVRIEEGSE